MNARHDNASDIALYRLKPSTTFALHDVVTLAAQTWLDELIAENAGGDTQDEILANFRRPFRSDASFMVGFLHLTTPIDECLPMILDIAKEPEVQTLLKGRNQNIESIVATVSQVYERGKAQIDAEQVTCYKDYVWERTLRYGRLYGGIQRNPSFGKAQDLLFRMREENRYGFIPDDLNEAVGQEHSWPMKTLTQVEMYCFMAFLEESLDYFYQKTEHVNKNFVVLLRALYADTSKALRRMCPPRYVESIKAARSEALKYDLGQIRDTVPVLNYRGSNTQRAQVLNAIRNRKPGHYKGILRPV